MPNWCENIIKITGMKSNLDVLKNKLNEQKDESINFMEYLIGKGDIPDDYYEEGWWDYNLDRFGTKWDFPFSDIELTIEEDSLSFFVDSANSPIIPFLLKLCKKHKVNATIEYYEPGSNYGGRAEIDTDGVECNNESSYLEALFQYRNEAFWHQVERFIEEKYFENLEDFQQSVPSLSPEDKDKLEMLWTANKYNL